MDEVRVYRLTFYFSDGSSKSFDGEFAFWGTIENAWKNAVTAAGLYADGKRRVVKIEVEEID